MSLRNLLLSAVVLGAGLGLAPAVVASKAEFRVLPPVMPGPVASDLAEVQRELTPDEHRLLAAEYAAAIRRRVTENWLRPESVPLGQVCKVNILQAPGGRVVLVAVDSACPFDGAGRMSVEDAVRNAQPLPYEGYESVFRTRIVFSFKAQDLDGEVEASPMKIGRDR